MPQNTGSLMLVLVSLCFPVAASAVPIVIEDWSIPGSTAGWVAWPEDQVTLSENEGTLFWSFSPSQDVGAIAAYGDASGGHFVGDLMANRPQFLGMDIRPDAGTQISRLTVYIDSPTSTWYYDLSTIPPQAEEWTHYELLLDDDPGHWVNQMGPESLQETLSNVSTFMMEIGEIGGGGSGRLDNVELARTPEPATFGLLLGGVGMILLRRRAGQRKRQTN